MSLVYFIEFNQNIKNDLFMVWLFVENFPQTFKKKQAVSMTIVHVYENLRCNIATYNKIRKIPIYIVVKCD